MRCTLIRRRRLLPLLLLVPLLLPGCATLYWQEGARTIGEPTETTRELDEPAVKLSVAGDTDEALAILVEVERRRLVESHQDIRLRREGHWQNGEMHGTRWFGALAAHHILWGLLGVVALARGDIPDDVGYVSFVHSNVGAAVLSIPALFNISTENMAPVMRPGKRKTVTRTERELRLAARGAEVTLLNGDTELGTATTDRSGEATFALTADDPAALENTVQARSGASISWPTSEPSRRSSPPPGSTRRAPTSGRRGSPTTCGRNCGPTSAALCVGSPRRGATSCPCTQSSMASRRASPPAWTR